MARSHGSTCSYTTLDDQVIKKLDIYMYSKHISFLAHS